MTFGPRRGMGFEAFSKLVKRITLVAIGAEFALPYGQTANVIEVPLGFFDKQIYYFWAPPAPTPRPSPGPLTAPPGGSKAGSAPTPTATKKATATPTATARKPGRVKKTKHTA